MNTQRNPIETIDKWSKNMNMNSQNRRPYVNKYMKRYSINYVRK